MFERRSIGKIFISHSSVDKPFVRRLAKRLKSDGYSVWLDEAELVPGDSLSTAVSEALLASRVVLVVVSQAAIRSRWLKFEINKATERMVQGLCRVIPLVIEDVALPPEVQGLLYADFRKTFALGYRGVSTALQHEVARLNAPKHFYEKADSAAEAVFGNKSYVSVGSEYTIQEYQTLSLPYLNGDGNEYCVVYDEVTDYLGRKELLSDTWLSEFSMSKDQFYEDMFLILSERPIGFPCDGTSAVAPRVKWKKMSKYDWDRKVIFLVDLCGLPEAEWKGMVQVARDEMIHYGKEKALLLEPEPADDATAVKDGT